MTTERGHDFDLVVVGAGIHGAAVAGEAGKLGYRVLLMEQYEKPGRGTSSRSSKLIHGGLRYLESLEFHLVHECLADRQRLLERYPDLVKLREFFIPVYTDTRRSRWVIGTGLCLYALLGGLKKHNRFRALKRHEWRGLDGLDTHGLLTVFRYYDAQTDDAGLTERLTGEAAATGTKLMFNTEFLGCDATALGVTVEYRQDGNTTRVTARWLINAAGPWVNQVAERCRPGCKRLEIDLVQGAHIEIPGRLDRGIYYLEAPQDRRAVFAMPWRGHTLVGTTETVFTGTTPISSPSAADIEYLLAVYNRYFGGSRGARIPSDVIDSWSGLRVLPRSAKTPFRRSRETILLPNRPHNPNIISIYGGKLTNHHSTACKVLKLVH